MRNWLKFYLQWHPPIMHDLHESEPFLYTFSGQAPQNPTLDPILYAELPWFVEFRNDQDDWLRHAGRVDARVRGYVVAGVSGLHVVEPQRHAAHVRDVRQRRRQHHEAHGGCAGEAAGEDAAADHDHARMVPAAAAVRAKWSGRMRNNTNYMETGVLARAGTDVQISARRCSRISTRRAATRWNRATTEAPFGYVLPAGQRGHDAGGVHREHAAPARHRGGPRDGRSETEGRHVPRRFADCEAQSAVRPAGEDPARKAEFSRRQPCALTTIPAGPWG